MGLTRIVEVLRMPADATGLQVLWGLTSRGMSINELAQLVGKAAPSVAKHLAKLRMARPAGSGACGPRAFALSATLVGADGIEPPTAGV